MSTLRTTTHKVEFSDARNMKELQDSSVDLMLTSPPYPMIEMWDSMFGEMNHAIAGALNNHAGTTAFELMHKELDKVWAEVCRVLKDGGIACINIGDATRKIDGKFQLFSNHARIINFFVEQGFGQLPSILWRKQTNAPNKFMGSGMLPPGAYVTLEHEFILILRKGRKREFKAQEKSNRSESAYFWEERNTWFSDIWDFKGTRQLLTDESVRDRSAAYPFELAYRLVNMFTVKGDSVLDPFLGTGTTTLAAMTAGRNSIGYEIDLNFKRTICDAVDPVVDFANGIIQKRLQDHKKFITARIEEKGPTKHKNEHYGFSVITNQERALRFDLLKSIESLPNMEYMITYDAEYPTTAPKLERRRGGQSKRQNVPKDNTEEPISISSEEEKEIQRILKDNSGLVSREGAIRMVLHRRQ